MNPNFFRRTLLCAFLLCLLCLLFPAAAAPTATLTLPALLARHRKASGTAVRLTGGAQQIIYDIAAGGLTGTLTSYEASGKRSRSEVRLGPLAITTGTDGKTTWQQDGTGAVRILGGEELSENKADAGFSLENVDPVKTGGKAGTGNVTLRPGLDPDTGCYVLDVLPKGGTQQTIYLDPKTYLVRKSVVQKGGIASTITILAYQTEFGAQVPSRLQIQPGGLPLTIEATLRQATHLPAVAAALFQPPAPARDWEFTLPGAARQAAFPVATDDNEVVVRVSVNGHPLRFLLDSGAGGAFVTAQAAEAAGLTTQGSIPALGYGGASVTGLAAETTLEVGGVVRLSRQTLHVIKDPNVARLLSDRGHVDGAIGYELLTRFVTTIDYIHKRVTLNDPTATPVAPRAGSATVPLKLENQTPTVLASVDGHPPARFLVDTGDAGSLHLYSRYAEAHGLLPRANDPRAQTRVGVGVGGAIRETVTPGHTLRLGGLTLTGLSLATMTGPGITAVSTHAGGIGNLALSRYQVTFDYTRGLMTLAPALQEQAGRSPRSRPLLQQGEGVRKNGQGPRPPSFPTSTPSHLGGEGGGEVTSLLLAADILPDKAPATAPAPPPATPPAVTPATPPAVTPATPPAVTPATPPAVTPATPPAVTPATPPAVTPATPPAVTPVAPDKAPGLTLEALLQKHLEALGGADALAAIKNTRVTSSVQTGGIQGTIMTLYAAPDREYEEDKLGILDITQGYDGKTAWQRDTNGNVRPLAGEELKDLRVQLYFDTNSYVLPGRIPGALTLRPAPEAVTGNYVVDALPDGGKPTTLFFDPQTFFIVKEQHLDDNVQVTTTYDDYRTVDGARFPFRMTTTNGTARYDIVGTVTKVENNIPLPDGLFAPPAGGQKYRFLHPGQTSATVPFDMDDGEIGLAITLDGQPARVFLDSGASGIALSQQTATRLGLKSSGFLEARGYGGSTDLHPVLVHRFEVPGAVALTDIAAIAIDLPDTLNSYFTRPVSGFVGYDLLAHFVVRVDFPRRKLTFLSPETFHPAAQDGLALPLELDNDVPSVEAQLDSLPPQRFLIDTGDESTLRLYSPFVAQYKLNKKYPRGMLTLGGGIGGVSRSRVTRVGSLRVAGVTLRGVPTDFSLDPKGGASRVNAGSLGASLLSRFVVTFDYPHSRVFFAPTPKARAPFVTETTGLTLAETRDPQGRAHVVVAQIQPNAPALRAGLNAFDEVLAVDGQRAARLGLGGVRRLLSPQSGRRSHILLVQSTIGKPRQVRVAVFDPLR